MTFLQTLHLVFVQLKDLKTWWHHLPWLDYPLASTKTKSSWNNKLGTCIQKRLDVFILKIRVSIICDGARLQQWINLEIETMLDYYPICFHTKFQPHRTFCWKDIIARSRGGLLSFFPNVIKLAFRF